MIIFEITGNISAHMRKILPLETLLHTTIIALVNDMNRVEEVTALPNLA
jgi:hypothetical protein